MVLNLLNLYSLIIALFHKISYMTSEQQNFKNISCIESNSIYTSPMPYGNNSTNEYTINPPIPAKLISDLAFNISSGAYRRLLQIVDPVTDQSDDVNYDYYIDYLENSTILNTSDILYENISSVNETIRNYTNFDILNDLKDIFVDHLTYLLNMAKDNETETTIVNISNVNITDSLNFNETNVVEDSFNIFKSAIMSLLPNNSNIFNETVDEELSIIYNELSTTLVSLQESTTFYPITSEVTSYGIGSSSVYDIGSVGASSISTTISTTTSTKSSYTTSELVKGNYSMCAKLRSLCWETMFGQELIKLTVMDLIMTILYTLAIDCFRGVFVRVMNRCWCWDLEKKFPKYGDFKVAENILHLVNNQGMVWMGMFFSPGLVVLNVIKLHIMMYFRTWTVLSCNVPHEVIFRASRSNNFYYALLLMMLFLCVLPVGFAIVWTKPSFHCGPFSTYERIFHIFTETIRNNVPKSFQKALDYIASPGIVIPLLVLLILVIYYLISLTGALREANEDLKIQLRRERTEERRKMFQIADRRRVGSGESNEILNTPFAKFRKILGNLPIGKSIDDTPKQDSGDVPQPLKEKKADMTNKDFFIKLFKKALGKPSISDEDQNVEDGTDTEQHDSLPDDSVISKQLHKPVKPSLSWNNKVPTKKQRTIDSCPSTESVEIKAIHVQGSTPRYSFRHFAFDSKPRDANKKYMQQTMPSTSKDMRQDSFPPVWSENIPVITISKTESAENILEDRGETSIENSVQKNKGSESWKSKPKIKCALKKQSTEIDEDTICHFSKELERNLAENEVIKAVADRDLSVLDNDKSVEISDQSADDDIRNMEKSTAEDMTTDKSSSEETEYKDISLDTVLKSPHITEER